MNHEMTVKRVDTYLEAKGVRCPYCGSTSIDGGSIDYELGGIYQQMGCGDCDGEWVDGYTLDRVADANHDFIRETAADRAARRLALFEVWLMTERRTPTFSGYDKRYFELQESLAKFNL